MGNSAGDAFYKEYEAKLNRAAQMAFISNMLYSFTWFLGFCALTWASAVILGGLLTSLSRHDYYSTVALLLLESLRLSTTTFFGKFVTLKLVHGSADPQRLLYHDAPRQNLLGLAHILEQAVQLTVLAISILVPVRRLLDLNKLAATGIDDFDGLKTSLRIFYVLVLVNGVTAGLAVMFSKHVVPLILNSISLRKFYEKIVWKGMDEGLLHATDFDLLSWTFEMQADEYRSNRRALVVKDLYGDMLKFLYFHPRHKGFEAAKMALDSSDTFEREAAANIVGLWVILAAETEKPNSEGAASGKGQKSDAKIASASSRAEEKAKELDEKRAPSDKHVLTRLLMQTKLLAKLAEVLDNDESGRAASSSFLNLASIDPKRVLMVKSEGNGEMVADIMMDEIHQTVEMGRPNNALIYIKAMIPLLPYLIVSPEQQSCMIEMKREEGRSGGNMKQYCTPEKLLKLKEDMWTIVSQYASGLKRLQAVAAYVYDLLSTKDERKDTWEELQRHLMTQPADAQHILPEEAGYLKKLLGVSELPSEWKNVNPRRLEKEKRIPCLARRTTASIASLVSLVILLISSIFIMRYGDFLPNLPF